MSESRLIGQVVRLQIQRSSLKLGEKPHRQYDPAPLLSVEALTLTAHGAEAHLADGTVLLDVHNANHAQTRNSGGNTLSVGFTAHYALIRARFGEHLPDGQAGENILVETTQRVPLEAIAAGLIIQTAQGGQVWLNDVSVAAPCKPFTGYLLQRQVDSDTLKRSLQFLDGGLRGFYVTPALMEPAVISVGDQVFSASR